MNYYNGPNPQQIPPPMYKAPTSPWNKPIRRNANIVCFGLLLVLLLGNSLAPVFTEIEHFFATGLEIKSPRTLSFLERLSDLAVYLLMFLIPLTIMRLWIGIPLRVAFPVKRPRASIAFPAVLFCFGAAVAGIFSASAVSAFFHIFFGFKSHYYPMSDPIGWAATIVYVIHVTFTAAIVEELVFRGVIMQSLRRFGDTFALVCSSVLFGLTHHHLEQSVITFVIGLAIGFFVLRSGSLQTGMMIHFCYNSAATAIDFATKNLPDKLSETVSLATVCVYMIAGLIGFAILMFLHSGIFKLAKSGYPVPEGKKYFLFFFSPVTVIFLIFITVVIFLF